jgi:acetylornithine deacetylase/succinyl-diaminopimelate desuccinylase-like protein
MNAALDYARANRARFVRELIELVRFPSVSGRQAHAADLERCAAWLADHLRALGLDGVRNVPTAGAPFVLAERRRHGSSAPSLLVYGHYDVQPADETWRSPPFAPLVRGENLYGRGASDDKGQFFTHLKAIESWLRATGEPPVDVVVMLDGEEEVGSPGLLSWLTRHADELRCDAVVISDMPMFGKAQPALTSSMRGSVSLELEVSRAGAGLHSGNFGGAIPNPLAALCRVLASLHGADGRVAVPGFYDEVRQVSPAERELMRRVGPTDAALLEDAGVSAGVGEPGFSLYERTTIRPAVTVAGCSGGYQGEGSKAVIPARASAKLDVRLVPDQQPGDIARRFAAHVERLTPAGVESRLRIRATTSPVSADTEHPAVQAALQAYRSGFGVPAVLRRLGGSLPVASFFQRRLGLPLLLMGFALPDDRIHGPDEKLHLPTFFRAIDTSIALMPALRRRLARAAAAPRRSVPKRVEAALT